MPAEKEKIMVTTTWLRLTGLAGILGGLLLFAGDMRFYYNAFSLDIRGNMAHASDLRIDLSALPALSATWLYLLVYCRFTGLSSRVPVPPGYW